MAGTLTSCSAWFSTSRSQVSAHYGVGLDGDFVRYVSRKDTAWANGLREPGNTWPGPDVNPNWLTVSIETEDLGDADQEVTVPQFTTCRTLIRTVLGTYPKIQFLMGHYVITPMSRPNCPGSRWTESGLLQLLADECGLQLVG
jgi:N-acetyl-anhydromuramyl-L-alanine amidase AmpD